MSERAPEKPFVPDERVPEPVPRPSEPLEVRVQSSVGRALRCPFCHESVASEREASVACERCRALHHRACWLEAQRCAACRGSRSNPRIRSRPWGRVFAGAVVALVVGTAFWTVIVGPTMDDIRKRRAAVNQEVERERAVRAALEKQSTFDEARTERRIKYRARLAGDPSLKEATSPEFAELTRAIVDAPDSADAWGNRAYARANAHDFAGSGFDYDAAIELETSKAWLYTSRGWVRMELGNLDGAQHDLDRTIELDSKQFWAWNNLGCVRMRKKDLKGATAAFSRALEIDSTQVVGWTNRSLALRKDGMRAGATADGEQAIRVAPDNVNALVELSSLLLDGMAWEEARLHSKRATELEPSNALAWSLRGRAHHELDESRLALAAFTRAIELDPSEASYRRSRADVLDAMGDFRAEAADLTHAIELGPQPSDMSTWQARARAREKLGDLAGALADLNRTVKLSPGDPSVWVELARFRIDHGDPEQARADLQRALDLDPKFEPALQRMREVSKTRVRVVR